MDSTREQQRQLGRLERVDPRIYWSDEARDFTPWLGTFRKPRNTWSNNWLVSGNRGNRRRVGPFRADILAREIGTENLVLIENQLDRTNHDHLGKLITYASGLGARTIIWIAREISEDHRKAIEWLNDLTDESLRFFDVELELWQIGDSDPAPRFNVVAEPNEWAKSFRSRAADTEPTGTKQLQLEFWRELIRFCQDRGTFLSLTKAPSALVRCRSIRVPYFPYD